MTSRCWGTCYRSEPRRPSVPPSAVEAHSFHHPPSPWCQRCSPFSKKHSHSFHHLRNFPFIFQIIIIYKWKSNKKYHHFITISNTKKEGYQKVCKNLKSLSYTLTKFPQGTLATPSVGQHRHRKLGISMDFILHNHVFVSTEMKFEWLYCWTMKLTARKKRHFLAWYNSPPFPGTAWWCPVRSGGAVWDTSPCPTLPGLPSERVPWLLGRGSATHYCSVHPHRPGSGGLPVNKNKTI